MTNTLKYEMVSTFKELTGIIRRCKKGGPTALDFETTSLDPADGRVRLVSLCNKKVSALVDFYQIKGGFKRCAKLFDGGEWIVFNAGFELRWFLHNEANPSCLDVGNLRRAILGGGSFRLIQIAKWDIDVEMNKTDQLSNWDAEVLTQDQLDYAYFDADVTWRLWQHWSSQADEGHWRGFKMLNNMVPAVIEMETAGMKLDIDVHKDLVDNWEEVKADRIERIRDMVGEDEVANLNSDAQWSDFFATHMNDEFLQTWPRTVKTGQLSMKNDTLKLLAGVIGVTGSNSLTDLLDALTEYKTINKYISSFGETLVSKAFNNKDGRIHARFNIGYAKTCRFSSSNPNLQQTPRDRDLMGQATSVRRSFIAGMGRKLVSLDYSGIELRVLALMSGDQQLLQDMVEGDVHSEVAAVIAGKPIDKKTKEGKAARQEAKGVSFGIIYGSGAGGLSATMRTSVEKAQGYIDFWRDRYPDAFELRYKMMAEVDNTRFIRMVDGRTVYMGKEPELPKCANYPVQSAAFSCMAAAIVRHKDTLDLERMAGKQKMTRMLSTIHDALIDEAAVKDAERCLQLMEHDMIEGYLDIFPDAPTDRLVEGGIGPNWGELD